MYWREKTTVGQWPSQPTPNNCPKYSIVYVGGEEKQRIPKTKIAGQKVVPAPDQAVPQQMTPILIYESLLISYHLPRSA